MYAAAGGASLASRRHKHKQRNTADTDALIHQQFQKRFQQHQQQYAPASMDHHLRASSTLTPSTPITPFGQVRLPGPFDPAENKTAGASVAWPGPVGQTPDSELGTAPDGSILLPLPGDPQKKWTKKNKIHDALSFGDSSGDRRLYELQQGAAANTLLYVGLCSVALGLIISFVGTGEKGFKTVQLRFIGPGMIVIGVCCCAVRIMLCFCPAFCFKRRRHKGPSGKMAEFYKYMPFRNHPLAAAPATEAVPMTVLKPALKRTCDAAVTSTAPTTTANSQHLQKCQQSVMRPFPMATPEASLESSLEHLIEEDDHLYTKDEMDSKKNLSSLKSTITFEDSLNVGTEMMVKSFEELHDTSSLPGGSSGGGPATVDPQELVLSAANLPK